MLKISNEDKQKIIIVLMSIVLFTLIFSINKPTIHSATMDDLINIDHIGEQRAELIIDYCKDNPDCTVEDLLKIDGVGKKLIENLKEEFH